MIGKIFNDCKIEEKVATATTGIIYRGLDEKLHVSRAVKIIHPQLADKDIVRKRFRLAIQAWAKLDRPQFVQIFSAIDDEHLGFVMDYVDGISLESLVKKQGHLGISQAVEYFIQFGKSISFAHQQNILHRKLSPSSIFISKNENIKIMGLGAIRNTTVDRVTPQNLCIGKIKYMSPEQFGGNYSAQTEIYTLGAIFYEMLTGKPPFEATTVSSLYRMHFKKVPVPPSHYNSEINKELEEIVLKALNKKPEERYNSVAEMVNEVASANDRIDFHEDTSIYSLMSHGRKAFERRKLENAIYFFNKVLSIYGPETPYFEEAQEKRNLSVKQKQEEEDIRKIRDLIQEALEHFDEDELEETRECVKQIFYIVKDYPDSLRIKGATQDIIRELPDIVEEVTQEIDNNYKKSSQFTQQGCLALENDNYEDAMQMFQQALQHNAKNVKAIQMQNMAKKKTKITKVINNYRDGLFALKERKYSDALEHFSRVLSLNANHEKARKYHELAKSEKERLTTKRIEINNVYKEALSHYEKWRYTEAIDKFAQVLDLDDSHNQARQFIDQAKRRLDEDNEIEDISFFFQNGISFFKEKQWQEAIACFNRVLKHMPSHKKALEYQNLCKQELHKQETFEKVLEEGIQLFEDNVYDGALEHFEYLLKLDENNEQAKKYQSLCLEFIEMED